MWSLGCVIAELFLGWPLYPGALEYDQVSNHVLSTPFSSIWHWRFSLSWECFCFFIPSVKMIGHHLQFYPTPIPLTALSAQQRMILVSSFSLAFALSPILFSLGRVVGSVCCTQFNLQPCLQATGSDMNSSVKEYVIHGYFNLNLTKEVL